MRKFLKDPSAIAALLHQIGHCEDVNVRHHAALLLKKKITVLFGKLNAQSQAELKAALLNILMSEPVKVVATALAG